MPKKKGKKFSLTAPIKTRKQFKREVKAATKLQFGPLSRQLQGEKRAEKEFRRRAEGYFGGYQKAVDSASKATSAAYSDALNKINSRTDASSAYDEQLRSRLDAEARADAEKRGATYKPSSDSTQASLNRRTASDVFGGLVTTQGARQSAYLADKARIGEGEKWNQLNKSHARSRALNQDKRELAREKGAFRTEFARTTRQDERQYKLERAALKGDRASRRSQMKLAKQYGKNERKSQKRSFQNQAGIAKLQGRIEALDDARGVKNQKKIAKLQARIDKKGDKRSARLFPNKPAKDDGGSAFSDGTVRNWLRHKLNSNNKDAAYLAQHKQDAVAYLVNRGATPQQARKIVNGMANGGKPKKPKYPNAVLGR